MFNFKTKEQLQAIVLDKLADWQRIHNLESYKQASSNYARLLEAWLDDGGIDKDSSLMTPSEKEALDIFIPLCEATIYHKQHLFSEQVDKIMYFLHKPACVDYMKSHPSCDKVLSWYTCYIGTNYVFPTYVFTDATNNTKLMLPVLIENWTGKKFEAETPSLENVVKHLFGNAYWELFGNSKESISQYAEIYEILYNIIDLNPPLVFRENLEKQASVNVAMPNNIIL